MEFILINIFLGVVIFLSLIVLWFVWPPDSPWSPWWQVGTRQIRESLKLAKVTKDDVVYDLGSGDSRVPIIAAREFGVPSCRRGRWLRLSQEKNPKSDHQPNPG